MYVFSNFDKLDAFILLSSLSYTHHSFTSEIKAQTTKGPKISIMHSNLIQNLTIIQKRLQKKSLQRLFQIVKIITKNMKKIGEGFDLENTNISSFEPNIYNYLLSPKIFHNIRNGFITTWSTSLHANPGIFTMVEQAVILVITWAVSTNMSSVAI